jgi:hypothetical protein
MRLPHQLSQHGMQRVSSSTESMQCLYKNWKSFSNWPIYPKLWSCRVETHSALTQLCVGSYSALTQLTGNETLHIFWITVELSKFFIFMRIQEKSQINILSVEGGEQWLVDRLRQLQCSHQPTACVGHPRGSCHHLNHMTTEGWRLKGTLTRDILAFFIISNIKSVFF